MKRILILFLAAVLAVGMSSCGSGSEASTSENGSDSGVTGSGGSEIGFTDYDLVKDGKSDYSIVIPDEGLTSAETLGYTDLKVYFKEATGIELKILTDGEVQWSESVSYLSVGNTKLLEQAGVVVDDDVIGVNGYRLETKGRSLFMAGGKEYGTLYAVYHFLRDCFGFEVYAVDEIVVGKNITSVKLPDYDLNVVPDIQQLQAQYGNLINDSMGALRLGYQQWSQLWMYGAIESSSKTIGFVHNTLSYVPLDDWAEEHPEWFSSDRSQLCLSNEEMYRTALLPAVKEMIESKPDVLNISVTQMDVRTWCDCALCSADKQKYGTDAGNNVKFGNKLAKDIREWLAVEHPGRKVNVVIFAYHNSEAAPAVYNKETDSYEPMEESLKFEENLVLWWCPSSANYKEPLTEGANRNYLESMKAWSTMAHTIYVWNYDTNYACYLANYNTFDVLQKNMQFFRDYNVQLLFNQGEHNQPKGTDFTDLSIYLTSKLRWNVDADYEGLIEDFFKNYYKTASDEMLKLFNHLRVWENYMESVLGFNGLKNNTPVSAKYWPKGVLDSFMEEIDAAYQAIEPLKNSAPSTYEKLYWRICTESLTFRYAIITLYSSEYTQSELLEMKLAFRADADRIGIGYFRETGTINQLYSNWGIA